MSKKVKSTKTADGYTKTFPKSPRTLKLRTIATSQHNISQHCWPSIGKLRPNDRNISTQQFATLLGAARQEPGQTTTTSCHIHKCCVKYVIIFRFEPTAPNMSQHIETWWSNVHNRVRSTMLRSFGRGLVKGMRRFVTSLR